MDLRKTADLIIKEAIASALPDAAVKRALSGRCFPGSVYIVAIGKAAWQMASAVAAVLGEGLTRGIVITKYGHVNGAIPRTACYEAGHPTPDENTYRATEKALELVSGLSADDTVILLISGGGSALFEQPLIGGEEMSAVTEQLLASGADIREINTIRKRLSAVKGGRFGLRCRPAHVLSVILSDVLGDPPGSIASGPAYPDDSTTEQALEIVRKYRLRLSEQAIVCLKRPLPDKSELSHIETLVTGSVKQLCASAKKTCERLGIEPVILTDTLCTEARLAGRALAERAKENAGRRPVAFIEGGETVVRLTGKGLGGRNQELALAAAEGISGLPDTAIFSVGSDGTDGPTDAAGGFVDGTTYGRLRSLGIDPEAVLRENDSFHALEKVGGLVVTGPTGTNVNDLSVLLML